MKAHGGYWAEIKPKLAPLLGHGEICSRCGATLASYFGSCLMMETRRRVPCPGLSAVEGGIRQVERSQRGKGK